MHLVDSEEPRATSLQGPPAAESPSLLEIGGSPTRRQLALLNFVRRTCARPPFAVLLEDAAILAARGVAAERCAWGQILPGRQYRLTLAAADSSQGSDNRITHTLPLDGNTTGARVLQRGEIIVHDGGASGGAPLDPVLLREGMASGITVPLHLNARPAGLLGVYTARIQSWDADDMAFVETIAHMLAATSARLEAEDELHKERAARSALLESVDAVVMTLDGEGRILDMNQAGRRLTQYTLQEVQGTPFWNRFVTPGELSLVQDVFRNSRNQSAASEFAGWLLAKDGSQRRVSWTLKLLRCGEVQSIMLTGVDQTEQWKTTDKLRQITAVARHAIDALHGTQEEPPSRPTPGALADDVGKSPVSASNQPIASSAGGVSSSAGSEGNGGDRLPAGRERRSSRRHPYPYRQSVAPVVDGRLPRREEFVQVECQDVSAGGIAFYFDRVPEFKELVLMLGHPPHVRQLVCRVVRVAGMERDGTKRYLVGCRFIGRC